ncbi:MAG: HlyD family efflux transporter periplasmic adaptor subunit [Alistipes sp.]
MGKAPVWVIRWGVTVVAAIFVGILIGCWFIKYPDLVQAPVVITTINPPADLYARYDGLIDSIYVADGQQVAEGTLVAVLRSASDWRDVQTLGGHLVTSDNAPCHELIAAAWLDGEYKLGELQTVFADFQSKCRDYRHYLETGHVAKKKQLLQQQINKNKEYYAKLQRQYQLLQKDLNYQRQMHRRDSLLYNENVIASADYETSSQNLLQKQNSRAGFDATLTSTELQIIQTEQQVIELTIQQENEVAEHERGINASRQQLAAQIAQWKQQYIVEAPTAGCVTLVSYWSRNQHVKVGDKLASVVPAAQTEIVGRMQVPTAGFGKVKTGQTVNVKLNGYPYMEFGVLKGTITSISAVPETVQTQSGTAIAYIAEVTFTNGMRTTYKKELPMIQQMDGTGEIITKDMRLIGRFFNPIQALFNR